MQYTKLLRKSKWLDHFNSNLNLDFWSDDSSNETELNFEK